MSKESGTVRRSKPTDVLTPGQRSYCMSRIRGRNTKPGMILRRALWLMDLRYRVRSSVLGRPDIVFHSARIAVFVDGCQWHCCPKHWVRPKSNTEFWDRKFEKNRSRDATVNEILKSQGWKVLRFWEHDVESNRMQVARRISRAVMSAAPLR